MTSKEEEEVSVDEDRPFLLSVCLICAGDNEQEKERVVPAPKKFTACEGAKPDMN